MKLNSQSQYMNTLLENIVEFDVCAVGDWALEQKRRWNYRKFPSSVDVSLLVIGQMEGEKWRSGQLNLLAADRKIYQIILSIMHS